MTTDSIHEKSSLASDELLRQFNAASVELAGGPPWATGDPHWLQAHNTFSKLSKWGDEGGVVRSAATHVASPMIKKGATSIAIGYIHRNLSVPPFLVDLALSASEVETLTELVLALGGQSPDKINLN